jgi:hypothetical protein
MWFGILTLLTALIISISAAYYSILGLTAIFAAAFWPIVILGSSLEVGKIVSTLWLHKYWNRAETQYKVYLCAAVAILMLLTSMGVFGFLSKAHSDQSMISGDVVAKIAIYDEKIKQARDNITVARSSLTQMDAAVDQTMSRSTNEQGADKAARLRRSQATERNRLLKEIDAEQKKIQALNDQRAPIAAEVRKVEAEVGPIKYIAALIYGDNPEANVLEKAVRWVIILIVIVFDPLALTLLLAATKSIEWERRKPEPENLDHNDSTEFFNSARQVAKSIDNETYVSPEKTKLSQEKSIISGLETLWPPTKSSATIDPESDHAPLSYPEHKEDAEEYSKDKIAERTWKDENPEKTLKHQRELFDAGVISSLPWEDPEFRARALGESQLVPDNIPHGTAGEVRGFGISFPSTPVKGDMFLRVDRLPSVLYKFNGVNWIEIDKNLSDNHAYDDKYINHLIEKIASGEYDPELLSDAERFQIEKKLNS